MQLLLGSLLKQWWVLTPFCKTWCIVLKNRTVIFLLGSAVRAVCSGCPVAVVLTVRQLRQRCFTFGLVDLVFAQLDAKKPCT